MIVLIQGRFIDSSFNVCFDGSVITDACWLPNIALVENGMQAVTYLRLTAFAVG